MKKVPESQVSALKAHNAQKNQDTIERVNKAIDKLKKKDATINFETVAKAAGVSRATLYNNPKLKERIMGLRAIANAPMSSGETRNPRSPKYNDWRHHCWISGQESESWKTRRKSL